MTQLLGMFPGMLELLWTPGHAEVDQLDVRPRAYCVCDEAQTLVAQNIQHVMAMARSHGLACILAHQAMSQLNPPGGVDLRDLVLSCTSVKQVFSARDPWLQKYLSETSGRVRYASFASEQLPADVAEGRLGIAYAGVPGAVGVTVTAYAGPRRTPQDIQDSNRHDNLCILGSERSQGYRRWHGYAPLYRDGPLTEAEHRERSERLAWPPPGDETLVSGPQWPEPTAETIVPRRHPPVVPPADLAALSERLRNLKRRLDEE